MESLCRDLREEHKSLDQIVVTLTDREWDKATPFGKWSIRDEITHLAYFDATGLLSATGTAGFTQHVEELLKNFDHFENDYLRAGRSLSSSALLSRWRENREALLGALKSLDPKHRLLWYGPPMSARSFVTARIMETWAHGQDIADALGLERDVTDRLRHIAHIGVTTFGWSYANRGMNIPDSPVRVKLTSPGGDNWSWGPEDAANTVRGEALDFCLVVTQRRHVEDTELVTVGNVASEWMRLAQAFAGPPDLGPEPGRFRKRRRIS
ncbi:MAG: TIGR03084 family protein [Deltaproteobacteria bacterium HGW-Deltaproteobacteria-10]|nr:MAG: TIGR03084 family protein [Deltaproteobacteria bacterium HGW-Deltaproteobacteria-10]